MGVTINSDGTRKKQLPNYSNVTIARSTAVIQQSFGWMFGGLMISAITALAAASDKSFQRTTALEPGCGGSGLMVAEFGLVFFISAGMQRMSHSVAVGAFILYSALTGVTFSWIFLAYTGGTLFSGVCFDVDDEHRRSAALYKFVLKVWPPRA